MTEVTLQFDHQQITYIYTAKNHLFKVDKNRIEPEN